MSLLDLLYGATGLMASPVLLYKGATDPRWRHRIGERFGRGPLPPEGTPRVWFHAASVGEVSLLPRILLEMKRRHPALSLSVTAVTQAGRELAESRIPEAAVSYFPVDLSCAVRRAFRRIRPDLVVLAELEVWPNFLRIAAEAGVPVVVVNGRVSDRSWGRYRALRGVLRGTFERLRECGAQNETSARRLRELGVRSVEATGNLKFDVTPSFDAQEENRSWRKLFGWGAEDPVLVGGSTHEPEEQLLLEIWGRLRQRHPALRLILAPRHRERIGSVEKLIAGAQQRCYKRSLFSAGSTADGVVLLDSVGELSRLYSVATLVFIGGTFGNRGGQNMLEPAAVGKPVLSGPGVANFRDAARALSDAGAMKIVPSPEALETALGELLADSGRRQEMGDAARGVVEAGRGALDRTVELIERALGTRTAGGRI